MREILRKQRELCFQAWAKNKSERFPKHLYNHYYDVIIEANEPDYKEPMGVTLYLVGFIAGAVSGIIGTLILMP